jgi:hypothetical protein
VLPALGEEVDSGSELREIEIDYIKQSVTLTYAPLHFE